MECLGFFAKQDIGSRCLIHDGSEIAWFVFYVKIGIDAICVCRAIPGAIASDQAGAVLEGGGADGNEAPTGNMDGIESPGVGGGPGGGPR